MESDGVNVVDDKADLLDGSLGNAISVDENGVTVSTGIGGGGRPGFSSGGFALNEQYVLSGSPKTYQLKADVLLAPGAVPGRSTLKAGITEGGTLWSYDDVAETFSFDRYQYPRLEGRWLMF